MKLRSHTGAGVGFGLLVFVIVLGVLRLHREHHTAAQGAQEVSGERRARRAVAAPLYPLP